MLKTYFRTAFRNLWKHKTFSFINIIGLTIGLTSFILIALFIFDELTFDRLHTNINNIYRVVENKTSPDGKPTKRAGTGLQFSESAKTRFPEIQNVARISKFWRPDIRPGDHLDKIFHEDYIAANPGFLNVFSFPLLYGDHKTALTAPRSVVLTEETAKKFFGKADAVGKILYFDTDSVPYTVTGILQDFPVNSSISYKLLVSESSVDEHFADDWNSGAFATYFLLKPNTSTSAVNTKLDRFLVANQKEEAGLKTTVQLQALKDIHFYSNDIEGDSGKKGSISYIYVFIIVACFIIFIACINYINLSTARFTNRGKEIAVRKVSGASRATLINQFLTETMLVSFFSVLISILLANLLLPAFNSFTEKTLTINLNSDYRIWAGIFLTVVVVTFSAGLYPALFQSGLNPLLLLKSKIQLGKGNISIRRSLVVFQFTISIVLIAATIIMFEQMQYVNNKDMGFDKDQLIVVDIKSGNVRGSVATIKNELSKMPQVRSIAVTSTYPGDHQIIPSVKVNADNGNPTSGKDIYYFGVDDQFLPTYDIKILKGRNFFSSGADSSAVLINESAAKVLGISDPISQPITILSAKFGNDNRTAVEKPFTVTVAGIVKDFNFQSLHEPLAPMIMGFNKNLGMNFGYFTVKLAGNDIDATLKKFKDLIYSIDRDQVFEYHFLDQQWEMLYRQDKIRQTVFLIVALLAIFIAALGLLGLTIYSAEQRLKEIGIRKVLGASVGGIMILLSRDFLKLVLVASVIAVPIAWYFMHKWLQDFAYRININIWVFIASAMIAIMIALITIGLQVVKAALANPVRSLRSE